MQKRKSECRGDRPLCSVDPAHTVHRHGWYERYANLNDDQREAIERFLCCSCGRTISVLPTHRLPYVAMRAEHLEGHFDARAREGAPPPATEKEKGCANRAWARFAQRVDALTGWLGQMIRVVKPTAAALWCELRRQSTLGEMLHLLSVQFHTSVLKDYLCVRPWPAPAEAL
jgi:hypothetical protein